MAVNKQAWKTLTEDEKTSLSLQLGLSKSTWEAGEIMGRSHYKYLEIQYRAQHFLKIFTEHLSCYPRLVHDGTSDKAVEKYLRDCIEDRKKPKESILAIIQEKLANDRHEIFNRIEKELKVWEKSNIVHDRTRYDLVMDFDRWNSFRILPKSIQEPSAYKRRQKNVYKKHIKVISQIHPLSVRKILKLFQTSTSNHWYMPLVIDGELKIYKVKQTKLCLSVMNDIGLYLFKKKSVAEEYGSYIEDYLGKDKRECIDGLTFWPKYRENIKLAINYQEIQKISPTRKYLELALAKHQFL